MYTWNWVNNTFSTITFTRFGLLLCHCQWHYEEKHSEVAIIRHRFPTCGQNCRRNPNFFYYPLWPLTRFCLSPLVNDHQLSYITNLRQKKPIDIHHQHMHVCVCVCVCLKKKIANFCHLVVQRKTQCNSYKKISVEKSSSKSPNFEDLFFEIAIFRQWALQQVTKI
jgi:hypothetical protein